jgi:D-3-phosphoglycerate dehydrogenase / 2-oxoglutarate reductase
MSGQSLKVVITDCDHGDIEEEEKLFPRIGAELVLAQLKGEEDLIRVCKDADGILNQYSLMTRRVLEALPRCKVIARYGVGVDSIDLRAATDLGIVVANVPDYCVDEVALQAVTLLMALIRQTVFFDQKIKSGHWDVREGTPIHRIRAKTMGLVGCGRIGMEVARIVSALGMRVIVFDPYIRKAGAAVELVDLDTLLRESDFISIHCPLNESTRHLIGESAFARMKKKPLIVNTSRGPIVDEMALIKALEKGLVSGAGLDVMEKEPPDPGNPLLKMQQVILSPHMSFYSEESKKDLKRKTAEGVADVLLGKWPQSVVNSEVRGKTRAKISNA